MTNSGDERNGAGDFQPYFAAVRFLEGLANLPARADYMHDRQDPAIYLERLRYFLDLIGNPHRQLQAIHIAGTAGKGSVAALVQASLAAHGERAGLFTSPFPTTTIECIQVGDTYIAPQEFAGLVQELKPAIDRAYVESPYGGPSHFEILLTIALLYFQRQGCRWAVLEAGLGGRYDATNVMESPVATAITNVDYDHMDLLGNTLEAIATDKAGIIKPGSPFWTTERRPQLLELFRTICARQGAPFHPLLVTEENPGVQARNAALARAIVEYLGVPARTVQQAAARLRLPCRFEWVQEAPTVILDGAHNAVKMASVAHRLANVPFRRLHLVIGIAQNKDADPILACIVPLADHLTVTRFELKERFCAHPVDLAALAQPYLRPEVQTAIYLDPWRALDAALAAAGPEDLVLVTGSFFLVGELRTRWHGERAILARRSSF